MGIKKVKNIVWGLCLAAIASFTFTGCSKKNDPAPEEKKVAVKFTVTATSAGVIDETDITIQAAAANGDASQYGAPVWKINGVTQNNEDNIFLKGNQFNGSTKTYVLETVKPFGMATIGVECTNRGTTPITLTFNTQVDGKVQTNVENLKVMPGEGYDKQFTYTAN
ncbi:hypothetical protein [Chitinophaga qingshengii]|uniref:Lipocalin-like domain-containing protein n=1 Tax=Chitinophaga qingshengii TaxID=1569794 RepID=A0ABR7TU49_9BACT|nr:hypothetical protein [Chitinophaga qingshengii]MBC9933148.1 hypothetical protein [Chitinophaga qingshengii]